MIQRFLLALLLVHAVRVGAQPLPPANAPLLVVLSDTGETREGTRVFRPHAEAGRLSSELLRGFPARMVRLYRMEQTYLSRVTGLPIEPAYLTFTKRQGGFPGFGFWLGTEAKPHAGYVDLYEQRQVRARFGGVDQIFPHELGHVMLQQLAGERPPGGSTQGHAIGVRTDPTTAFDEGFAEHFQVMALDDPDVDPRTRRLRDDPYWLARCSRDAAAYRDAMTSRWAPAARARITFPFWYSADEQVWRYYAVKANAFARQPAVPDRLLDAGDPYAAYLLENVLPGQPGDAPKSAAQMLATEGVVSTLFWRWATSAPLRSRYRDEAFYASFGVARDEVPPELNVYLKLLHVFYTAKPHTAAATIAAYRAAFPEDVADVDVIVREVLLGQALPTAREIWLANSAYSVGTRVFDQFRASAQRHTFDLNAASVSDLVAVPGVDRVLALRILLATPFESIDDMRRVPELSGEVRRRFAEMSAAMTHAHEAEEGASSLFDLLWAFAVRALAAWVIASAIGAVLFKRVRRCGWLRAIFSGAAASFVTLAAAWVVGSTPWTAGAALVLFGLPGLLLSLRRRPLVPALATTALAWLSVVAPALVLVTPLF